MRTLSRPSHRAGFTLIELLVVISILGVLAALTMAGISRVRSSQHKVTTEGTLQKLQVGLDQLRRASLDTATSDKNQYLPPLQTACNGDRDLAKSTLAYLSIKREFPQSFAEARSVMPAAPLPAIPGLGSLGRLPPHTAFESIPATTLSPDQEAAALLYLIINNKSSRGASIDADGSLAGAEMVIPGTNLKAYKDAYGTHIAFIRWYGPYNGPSNWGAGTPQGNAGIAFVSNPETQLAPFVNVKSTLKDSYDPLGKMQQWLAMTPAPPTSLLYVLNQNYAPYPGSPASPPANQYVPVSFDGFNKIMTVVSAGPDKTFGTFDDIYGYPLGRIGAKGD